MRLCTICTCTCVYVCIYKYMPPLPALYMYRMYLYYKLVETRNEALYNLYMYTHCVCLYVQVQVHVHVCDVTSVFLCYPVAQLHLSPPGQLTTPTKSPNSSYGQRPPSPLPPTTAGQPYYQQTSPGYPSPYTPPIPPAAYPSPPQMQAHGYYPPHPGTTPSRGFSSPNPPQGGGSGYSQQPPPNYSELYPQTSSSGHLPPTSSPQAFASKG